VIVSANAVWCVVAQLVLHRLSPPVHYGKLSAIEKHLPVVYDPVCSGVILEEV
jgi:hypothetical protein